MGENNSNVMVVHFSDEKEEATDISNNILLMKFNKVAQTVHCLNCIIEIFYTGKVIPFL